MWTFKEIFAFLSSILLMFLSTTVNIKGPLSVLGQFVTIENPSKTMKKAFYFML